MTDKSSPNDHLFWTPELAQVHVTGPASPLPPKQRSKCRCCKESFSCFSLTTSDRITARSISVILRLKIEEKTRVQRCNFRKCEETIQVLFPTLKKLRLCTLQNLAMYRESVSTFAYLSVTFGAAPRHIQRVRF